MFNKLNAHNQAYPSLQFIIVPLFFALEKNNNSADLVLLASLVADVQNKLKKMAISRNMKPVLIIKKFESN